MRIHAVFSNEVMINFLPYMITQIKVLLHIKLCRVMHMQFTMQASQELGISRAQCEEVLRRSLGSEAAVLTGFELRPLGGSLGFMGEHNVLSVTFELHGQGQERTFFMKQTPRDEKHFKYVVGQGLFAKEKEMYELLIPMMCKYLNTSKLPVPECYLISDNNFIIFEDLTKLGYNLHDKLVPLNKEYCKLAMEIFAQYHAGSIAIELKTGQKMSTISKHSYEVLLVGSKSETVAGIWHKSSLSTIFGLLKKMDRFEERLGDKWDLVHTKMSEAWDKCSEFACHPSQTFRNVLCHGDLWLNNVLFATREDGSPERGALIDFQIFRYTPPALDLVMFLHLTTTRHLRERHLLGLLLTYHAALQKALKIAGVENPISLDELLLSVQEYRFFGIAVAVRYLPTCLKQSGEFEAVKARLAGRREGMPQEFSRDSSDLLLQGLEVSPARRGRVLQAVDELLDWLEL